MLILCIPLGAHQPKIFYAVVAPVPVDMVDLHPGGDVAKVHLPNQPVYLIFLSSVLRLFVSLAVARPADRRTRRAALTNPHGPDKLTKVVPHGRKYWRHRVIPLRWFYGN
jgi:hypothetical protein